MLRASALDTDVVQEAERRSCVCDRCSHIHECFTDVRMIEEGRQS
jgi:hypothetical protein